MYIALTARRGCGRRWRRSPRTWPRTSATAASARTQPPRRTIPATTGCDVVNASAYRAFLLTRAAADLDRDDFRRLADRNLAFVLAAQRPDGSWPYAVDGIRTFVDHYHTCFVLKALAKIEHVRGDDRCRAAIDRGLEYDVRHLFDEQGSAGPLRGGARGSLSIDASFMTMPSASTSVLCCTAAHQHSPRAPNAHWRTCWSAGRGPTARSTRVNCSSAGTGCRCIVGCNLSSSELFACI